MDEPMGTDGGRARGRGEITSDTTVALTSITRQAPGAEHFDSVAARAVTAGASSEQVMNALVGPASGEWLLTAAVLR